MCARRLLQTKLITICDNGRPPVNYESTNAGLVFNFARRARRRKWRDSQGKHRRRATRNEERTSRYNCNWTALKYSSSAVHSSHLPFAVAILVTTVERNKNERQW